VTIFLFPNSLILACFSHDQQLRASEHQLPEKQNSFSRELLLVVLLEAQMPYQKLNSQLKRDRTGKTVNKNTTIYYSNQQGIQQ
jgi:hypothetical protein